MFSLIPLPYRLLGLLIAALALFGGGYWQGHRQASNACLAGQAKSVIVAQTAANTETTRREAIGTQREVSREQIRVVYRTIKEKADEIVTNHPEFNVCGLDADGLRLWNAANSGSTPAVPGEPADLLPGTASGEIGQPGGSAQESHRGDGAVQPVPGPAEQAGSVR